jgi:hypothetical protein
VAAVAVMLRLGEVAVLAVAEPHLAMLLGAALLALVLLVKVITVQREVVLAQQAQAAAELVVQQLRVGRLAMELHG